MSIFLYFDLQTEFPMQLRTIKLELDDGARTSEYFVPFEVL